MSSQYNVPDKVITDPFRATEHNQLKNVVNSNATELDSLVTDVASEKTKVADLETSQTSQDTSLSNLSGQVSANSGTIASNTVSANAAASAASMASAAALSADTKASANTTAIDALGTASKLNTPMTAGAEATEVEVVRGDDPRLVASTAPVWSTTGQKEEGFGGGQWTNRGNGDKVLIFGASAVYDGSLSYKVGTTAGGGEILDTTAVVTQHLTPANPEFRHTLSGLKDGVEYFITLTPDVNFDSERVGWCVLDPFYLRPEQPGNEYDHISVNGDFDLTTYQSGRVGMITLSSSIGTVTFTYGTILNPQTLTVQDGELATFVRNAVTGWLLLNEPVLGWAVTTQVVSGSIEGSFPNQNDHTFAETFTADATGAMIIRYTAGDVTSSPTSSAHVRVEDSNGVAVLPLTVFDDRLTPTRLEADYIFPATKGETYTVIAGAGGGSAVVDPSFEIRSASAFNNSEPIYLRDEQCYDTPAVISFAGEGVEQSNGDMQVVGGAVAPNSAPLRITNGETEPIQINAIRIRFGANGFTGAGSLSIGGVTYEETSQEDLIQNYGTIVFSPVADPLIVQPGESFSSRGNWGATIGPFQGPVLSRNTTSSPFDDGDQARASINYTVGVSIVERQIVRTFSDGTVQASKEGETTFIDLSEGVPNDWTLRPKIEEPVVPPVTTLHRTTAYLTALATNAVLSSLGTHHTIDLSQSDLVVADPNGLLNIDENTVDILEAGYYRIDLMARVSRANIEIGIYIDGQRVVRSNGNVSNAGRSLFWEGDLLPGQRIDFDIGTATGTSEAAYGSFSVRQISLLSVQSPPESVDAYLETETLTNKTYLGLPVYQKLVPIDLANHTSSATISTPHGIVNFGVITELRAIVNNGNAYYAGRHEDLNSFLSANVLNIQHTYTGNWSAHSGHYLIEYTKSGT